MLQLNIFLDVRGATFDVEWDRNAEVPIVPKQKRLTADQTIQVVARFWSIPAPNGYILTLTRNDGKTFTLYGA